MSTRRITKQQIERMIFNVVYDADEYAAVEHLDRPDFALQARKDSERFGVEITEVYSDESSARLQNIEGYFEELLAGKPHRHRDDIGELRVETVGIIPKDGSPQVNVRAVMQSVTGRPNLPTLLANRIRSKDAQAVGYSADLTHNNLVILNRTGRLISRPTLDEGYDVSIFLSPELRIALSDSRFNEVHLIVCDKDGVEIVRGLRALAMVEAAYIFLEAVKATVGLPFDCSDEDGHLLFIAACERQGLAMDYVVDSSGVRAQFGGIGVHFAERGIRILDGHRIPPRMPNDRPAMSTAPDVAEQVISTYIEFTATGTFSCEVASAPVRTFEQSRQELGISVDFEPED